VTAKQEPRFCDLAGVGDWLYALDRDGQVWKWSPRTKIWVPLPKTRAPASQDDSEET
jgi:hypothetical protein